jgi:hypothetical protein
MFILLFPPLLMFAAILWHTFRRGDARQADSVALPIEH